MNELDLFAAVIAVAEPGERAALLKRECASGRARAGADPVKYLAHGHIDHGFRG